MKIKKESLTKTGNFSDSENSYQKSTSDLREHDPVLHTERVQANSAPASESVAEEKVTREVSIKTQGTPCSAREPWHQTGILRQALLSISSSGQMEKAVPNVCVESVLPKIRDDLLPAVDNIKLGEDGGSVHTTVSRSSLSHEPFSPANDFSGPITSLPSVSSPFPLSFATLSSNSLNSNCTVSSQDTALPMITSLQTCDVHQTGLSSPSNDILSNSSGDGVPHPDADSSVSVASVDSISSSLVSGVSNYSAPSSNLCQALASLSSKDDSVTVVYSSVQKVEPSTDNLICNIQETVPLPSMSEVKSSLTNHLGVLSQQESKSSENNVHGKVSETLSDIASNPDSHNEAVSFDNLPSNEVNGTLSTIKLDEQQNSEFDGESAMSLSSGSIKFGNDTADITSNVVIPVSSDVILTKISGQSTTTHQDISHIITIPLPACTIYNSPLGIQMPLPLCNGNTPGSGTVQMTPAVVTSLPYSITGISNQACNSGWPNSAVTLSVTSSSNSQMSTSVSTSLPVSIMSVAPSMSSLQNNNMIHFSSNSIVSLPASTQVANSSVNAVSQDPVCYTVQSPAEILSQLSKAGVLPTMSSSQVSSILSALGPDSHVDLDSDAPGHNEILNSQVLPGGYKVSTVTQTDSLEMNVMQHDDKIIQLLNGQQLLEHQISASQLMMPSANQNDTLSPDASLSSSELITADVTEQKQNPLPFPRIVAMVLNTPNIRHEKQCVPDNTKSVFKNSEVKPTSNDAKFSSKHSVVKDHDNLQDFLVLPSNIKPCRRPKRTSALREMLLGVSESAIGKDSQCKKPRGRAKKSDSHMSANINNVKDIKILNKDLLCNGDINNSSFTKEVGCYKCKYCPFLSVEEASMVSHVKLKHCSEVLEVNVVRQELKCPGCPNVFYTTNSLEVHLKQDHQVSTPELKAISSSAVKVASEAKINSPLAKKKKRRTPSSNCMKPSLTSSTTNVGFTNNISFVRHSNSNITMLSVPGGLIMSNCDNDTQLITNDKKLFIKKLETDVFIDKSSHNFSNIFVQGNKNKDTESNESKDENAKFSEKEVLNTSDENMTNSITSKDGAILDSNVGEKIPAVSQRKKRGRPKGSRSSSLVTAMKSSDKDGSQSPKKTNIGHRCNVDHCAVTMRSPENIEYHRACHSGAEFQCPECSHTHCHWNGMSTHLWRAHMIDMELYTCDQCNYKTVSYAKLSNLHKWIHGSERPFLCDSCGKGFKNRKQLRNHKTIHQPKQMKLGECEICGRTFTNSRMLRMHLDNVHNKLRPHLCNYCGYSASSVSSLKMHMRKHTGEKPFRCQLCDYCTADHNSLRRHKMRHTGDKPYKCPHCPYACIQSSTYKAHLKTKHPGMDDGLMFSCNLCSFRSVKEENYLAHLAEHKTDIGCSSTKASSNYKQSTANEMNNLEEQPVSVIQLVECNLDDGNNECFSMVKLGGIDSSSGVQMTLESDFESEEITGDISEAELITGDIGEPQEFKMCDNNLKIKSP